MSCKNAERFKLVGQEKLTEQDEIEIRVKRKLPDCRNINALYPINVSGDSTQNKYRRPINRFECQRTGCVTSGLIMMTEADETATYRAPFDATEYAGGVGTFYVYPDENDTFPIKTTFKIGDDEALTNANVYEVTITEDQVTDDGFVPVFVDLSEPPTSTVGDGWTPEATGSYIQVASDKVIGYSSFSIYDSIDDFELDDVIKVGCLTSVGDPYTFETVAEQCQEVTYNQNVNTLPITLTGNRVSANYHKLNPMYGVGSKNVGFEPATTKKVVEEYTVDGKTYGKITLADANQDECGRIAVQIADTCDVTEAHLASLSIPRLHSVDEGHFVTIKNADGSTDVIFNEAHIGREMLVSYPKTATVEDRVYGTEFMGETEASVVWTHYLSDGTKLVNVYDNAFVTSFPMNITNETGSFSFSLAFARANDGYFYHEYRIQ